jgi:DNA-binding transcriptional MocR family regulator
VRSEARARRALAAEILPQAQGATEALHVWLDLAGAPAELQAAAERKGLSLVTAEAFATTDAYRAGVRISLGAVPRREVLSAALATIAELVEGGTRRVVV